MLKKFISILAVVSLSVTLFIFTASAEESAPQSSVNTVLQPVASSVVPTDGTRSPDPTHGAGNRNTNTSKSIISAQSLDYVADASLDIYEDSSDCVLIAVLTDGFGTMDKIGANNISVQMCNNNGQWINVDTRSSYDTNTSIYGRYYYVNVTPGYLYRAVCTHFATKYFLGIFPQTDTLYNVTDYIFVG